MQVSPVMWVEMQRSSCCIKTRELLPHMFVYETGQRSDVALSQAFRNETQVFKFKRCLSVNILTISPLTLPLAVLPADSDLDSGTAGCICWRYRLAHLLATCLSPPWSCIRAAAL